MTVVCALRDGRRTWIGSDREAHCGNGRRVTVPPKRVVEIALAAAIQHEAGCGGEPWVYCLGG